MPFINLPTCCLNPKKLPGTPRGELQPIQSGRSVARYFTKPSTGSTPGGGSGKTCIVLFYDGGGFGVDNPKILADTYADQVGLPVFVPDYIPNPPPVNALDPVMPSYPGEYKDVSWPTFLWNIFWALAASITTLPGLSSGPCRKRTRKALEELESEGWEKFGLVGFCRGGGMTYTHLSTNRPTIACGVINHPATEGDKLYATIKQPSMWHFADHDIFFGAEEQAKVIRQLENKPGVEFSYTVYNDTVHGFAARPNMEHENTKKAFEEANEKTVEFLKKHLL